MKKETVVVFDSNPVFRESLEIILPEMGLEAVVLGTEDEFLTAAVETQQISLFIIGLEIGTLRFGFELISKIRTGLESTKPILVISGDIELQAVVHALELGANDYLVKPFDKALFATKLAQFIQSEQLDVLQSSMVNVATEFMPGVVRVPCVISELDELGVKLIGAHLLPKGLSIKLEGDLITTIFGYNIAPLVTVISNEISSDEKTFSAYAEFTTDDPELLCALRLWLVSQSS